MAEIEWHQAIDVISPYVVRIWTPQGSGTGFIVSTSKATPVCAIATAAHVIHHAHYWEEPIRIEHGASGKTIMLRPANRAITVQDNDTAAIIFERGDLSLPENALPLTPRAKYFKPGIEIGWLGYPAIPRASLCFFSGRISAWVDSESAYLVDGVAINGVSGGPAFLAPSILIGVVSAYMPNRATGEPLPGLAVIRSVDQFHDIVDRFNSIDQAKAEETPPSEAPSVSAREGETPARGPRMA